MDRFGLDRYAKELLAAVPAPGPVPDPELAAPRRGMRRKLAAV
ncbi:hypothetical protein [Streptomyces wuyuanensis]|nr:hypothetical protein [Streptomyces wuyuanensis]